MMSIRLTSAAAIDASKQEKAQECALKVSGMIKNEGEQKGDKIKISLKLMQLESFLKAEKVLHTHTCNVKGPHKM
jgi:hypothetical protein